MATGSQSVCTVMAQVVQQPPMTTLPGGSEVNQQTSTPPGLPGPQFTTLLVAIQQFETWMEQRFSAFKDKLKVAKEKAAAKAASCIRREKPYEFKKKAHEEQATFNDTIKEAATALKGTTDSLAIQPVRRPSKRVSYCCS